MSSKNTIDLTNQRFGRLLVLSRYGTNDHRQVTWLCKCDCGNDSVVSGILLRKGRTKSCGCFRVEYCTEIHTTHGGCGTRLYYIWQGMLQRCQNPHVRNFKRYGGRGITICDERWLKFELFRDWALANGYQDNLTIDRKDNDKGYYPDNCQWIPLTENIKKRILPEGTHRGECNGYAKLTESDVIKIKDRLLLDTDANLAKEFNVSRDTIYGIRKGKTWTHV